MNRNEVIEALKTIHRLCEEVEDCSICPLRYGNDYCTLEKICPQDWKIVENNWRAFE